MLSMAANVTINVFGLFVQSRMETVTMRETVTFVETLDKLGRLCVRLNKKNGVILCRFRNDLTGQYGFYQWAREKNAVLRGYGDMCFDAIQCAMYYHGQTDFCPAVQSPEVLPYDVCYKVVDKANGNNFINVLFYRW